MTHQLPPPWSGFLHELDKDLSSPIELHCVGGFVVTVAFRIPRYTGDLDYLAAIGSTEEIESLAGPDSRLAKKYKVFIHRVGISDYPEDYAERLVLLELGLRKLRLKVLEPYDLLLAKLTRNSPKDREDAKAIATKLGLRFGELLGRFEREMKPWLPHAERHQNTLTNVWREYFPK